MLIVTPLRFLFPIVLVDTTIEVLTRRTRQQIQTRMRRVRVHDHVVIVGDGVKGAAALRAILEQGQRADQIIVLDRDGANIAGDVLVVIRNVSART